MWNLWEDQDQEHQEPAVKQPTNKAKKRTRTRLHNILVTKVALVDSPASGQRFIIAKRAPDPDKEREVKAILEEVKKMDEQQFDRFFAALDEDGQNKVLAIVEAAERQEEAQKRGLLADIRTMTPGQYDRFLDSLDDTELHGIGALLHDDIQARAKRLLLQDIQKMTAEQFDYFFASLEPEDQDGVYALLEQAEQG